MTDETPKKRAPRKVVAKKATDTEPKAPARRAPRNVKGPKLIRNLRNIEIHVRLEDPNRDKKIRVALRPRGVAGDVARISYDVSQSMEFEMGLRDGLFEVITQKEASEIQYPPTGYQRSAPVPIIRESDNLIAAAPDWDASPMNPANHQRPQRIRGRQNPEIVARNPRVGEAVNPTYADVPGSDGGLHAQLRTGDGVPQVQQQGAFPPGMSFERPSQVRIERTRT